MKKINAIMGTEGGEFIREVAYVRCNGCEKATKDRFTFTGTKSCAAVEKFYNGKGECRFGCDGYGDCAAVCGNDAITITGRASVIFASVSSVFTASTFDAISSNIPESAPKPRNISIGKIYSFIVFPFA